MHVGWRPESQVCPAAAAAAGGGGTVDGWRSDGRGPVGLLSEKADSKQTNTCTHTEKRKKEKTRILLTSISLRASSVSAAGETWESDGGVGDGGERDTEKLVPTDQEYLKGRGLEWRERQVEPCYG